MHAFFSTIRFPERRAGRGARRRRVERLGRPAPPDILGRRLGSVLLLAALIVALLCVVGLAGSIQNAGTRRAVEQALDLCRALEVAQAALTEAVVSIRGSLVAGDTTDSCPENWRRAILEACDDPASPLRSGVVHPVLTRSNLGGWDGSPSVSDVRVRIVKARRAQSEGEAVCPAQGVLELAVTVHVTRGCVTRSRTVAQRRVFHVQPDPQMRWLHLGDSASALITLVGDPIGMTVGE